MIKALLHTLITLVILAWAVPTITLLNWTTVLLASVVLTALYTLIQPILKVLFLPINIVTLGLFSVVINVFLLWLATYLVPGFVIEPMILFGLELTYIPSLVVVAIMISLVQNLIRKLV